MKVITVLTFVFLSFHLIAQNNNTSSKDLEKDLKILNSNFQELKISNSRLKAEIKNFNLKLRRTQDTIEAIKKGLNEHTILLNHSLAQFGGQLADTKLATDSRIDHVDKSVSESMLYAIIGVILAIIVSILIYLRLNKKRISDKSDIVEQLSKTKLSIEESLVGEFEKQTELMETQLQVLEQQSSSDQAIISSEPDHSLPMKVANEINLIERNISLMDAGTKGLKQLTRSVGKLKDNLAANGYEIVELLGKPYHQGLKIIVVNSVPDENLEVGQEVISKVLIPAVLYKEKMIQSAQVEVNVGV